jgi:hypothetical protein
LRFDAGSEAEEWEKVNGKEKRKKGGRSKLKAQFEFWRWTEQMSESLKASQLSLPLTNSSPLPYLPLDKVKVETFNENPLKIIHALHQKLSPILIIRSVILYSTSPSTTLTYSNHCR